MNRGATVNYKRSFLSLSHCKFVRKCDREGKLHLQFPVKLTDSNNECGICEVCVGRLRDASDFKLQVERSQAELQARLQGALQETVFVKEEPSVNLELSEDVGKLHQVKSEITDPLPSNERETGWKYVVDSIKLEMESDGEMSDGETQKMLEDEPAVRAGVVHHWARDGIRYEECPVKVEVSNYEDLMSLARAGAADSGAEPSHTQKRPYSCEICKRTFTTRQALGTHRKTHEVKIYSCKECSKQFTRKPNYIRHKRTHSGVKPYRCTECDKQFTQKQSLNIHKRIHTGEKPYSCKVCNKLFSKKDNLNAHARIHTGVKPYCCDICDASFARKQTLDTHKLIHSGVKAYSCKQCNKQFPRKSTLDRHEKTHTIKNVTEVLHIELN